MDNKTSGVDALVTFFLFCAIISLFVIGLATISTYSPNETRETRLYDMRVAFGMCVLFAATGFGLKFNKRWARFTGISVSTLSVIRLGWKIVYAAKGNGHDSPTILALLAIGFLFVIYKLITYKVDEQLK